MNIAEARESITSLLEDVHSRSGILTNAYVDEVRVKIATTASMLPVESRAEFVEPMRDALGILDSIQSNNSNEVMHQHVGAGVALKLRRIEVVVIEDFGKQLSSMMSTPDFPKYAAICFDDFARSINVNLTSLLPTRVEIMYT